MPTREQQKLSQLDVRYWLEAAVTAKGAKVDRDRRRKLANGQGGAVVFATDDQRRTL